MLAIRFYYAHETSVLFVNQSKGYRVPWVYIYRYEQCCGSGSAMIRNLPIRIRIQIHIDDLTSWIRVIISKDHGRKMQ